jgi:hypothetical protein
VRPREAAGFPNQGDGKLLRRSNGVDGLPRTSLRYKVGVFDVHIDTPESSASRGCLHEIGKRGRFRRRKKRQNFRTSDCPNPALPRSEACFCRGSVPLVHRRGGNNISISYAPDQHHKLDLHAAARLGTRPAFLFYLFPSLPSAFPFLFPGMLQLFAKSRAVSLATASTYRPAIIAASRSTVRK